MLVSTSLVAREYEQGVLLCKLYSEYECVDEFIFIESAYDTHGNPKGLVLDKILQQPQFKPFLDKITVLSNEKSFYPAGSPYDEQNNLLCEFNSRAYCWPYIQKRYSNDDWIFLEDCDELLDFSDSRRRDTLLDIFNKHTGSIQIEQTRYWWDFDNLSIYEKYHPCHQVGRLKEMENPFHHRNRYCDQVKPVLTCAFEYSHGFSANDNWIKVTTSAHDKYTQETMKNAYKYNTWHKEKNRQEYLQVPYDFFETIDLNEENSPRFVLDNLSSLKVNTVNPDYAAARVNDLQVNPHPCEQTNKMRGNRIAKSAHFYRRSK